MKQRLRAYKLVIDLKRRALEKAEKVVEHCIGNLRLAAEEVVRAETVQKAATARVAAADLELAAVMTDPCGFSANSYVQHTVSRAVLIEIVGTTTTDVASAAKNLQVQKDALYQARQGVAKAKNSLEACREMQDKLLLALQLAEEATVDEESAEAFVGRRFQTRRVRDKSASDVDVSTVKR
jgi:hypothetical protein